MYLHKCGYTLHSNITRQKIFIYILLRDHYQNVHDITRQLIMTGNNEGVVYNHLFSYLQVYTSFYSIIEYIGNRHIVRYMYRIIHRVHIKIKCVLYGIFENIIYES